MKLKGKETKVLVLEQFRQWPERAYTAYCFFYKAHQQEILQLPFDDYMEMQYYFLRALYETGDFTILHREASIFLEELIQHQEFTKEHKSVYCKTIELIALAEQNCMQQNRAIELNKSLVKMGNAPKRIQKRLFWLLFQRNCSQGKTGMAMVMIFLLLSLVVNALIVFCIGPFFGERLIGAEMIRNTIFGLGILNFLLLQSLYARRAYLEIKKLRPADRQA